MKTPLTFAVIGLLLGLAPLPILVNPLWILLASGALLCASVALASRLTGRAGEIAGYEYVALGVACSAAHLASVGGFLLPIGVGAVMLGPEVVHLAAVCVVLVVLPRILHRSPSAKDAWAWITLFVVTELVLVFVEATTPWGTARHQPALLAPSLAAIAGYVGRLVMSPRLGRVKFDATPVGP